MIPLSYAQRRLWFLNQIDPLLWYNVPLILQVSGELDVDALRAALADVVGRHEALRTVFPADDGQPYQRVLAGVNVLEVVEDPKFSVADAERHAFNLSQDVPLRAWLFPAASGERGIRQLLVLVIHHIASDGWSMAPLSRDLALAYAARTAGAEPGWEPLPVQYADYTLWQQDLLGDPEKPDSVFGRQLDYWREQLAGLPEELALPYDRPRPAEIDHQGARVPVRMPARLHAGLLDLARQEGATLFMVLHAGLSALLTRLGAGTDVPLGTAVAGRLDEALDDLVGFFVNTLVLRADTSGDPSFRELLARVRETDLAAYAHQDLPFDSVVEDLNPLRSLSRHPLFQTQLTLQNTADWTFALGDLDVKLLEPETVVPRFDLSFLLEEEYGVDGVPAGLAGEVVYRCDMFDVETVRSLVERLTLLLEGALAAPDAPVSQLEIMPAAELNTVLRVWNDTVHQVPQATLAVRALYGATETTAGKVPIGSPEDNLGAYVLDERLQPVPLGVPGELYLTGASRTHDDQKHAAQVAERLVAAPFGSPGQRMYRTGDTVTWRRDGTLNFVGPLDQAAAPVTSPSRPKSPEEEILARLMGDVLGRPDLGVNDSFFDLGGHSLLAARLQNRIQAVLGRRVPLDVVFKFPTPATLARVLSTSGERAPLRPADPTDRVPLSYAQQRMWYLSRFGEFGQRFNMSELLRVSDELDVGALRLALADVVGRHEALRTVFPEAEDGQGYQQVLDGGDVGGDVLEIAEPGFTVLEAERHAFDLTRDIPIRAWLFPAEGTDRLLLLVVHHIATDGWSKVPLSRDLALAYAARTAGAEPGWEPLPVQYADYTLWQQDLLGDPEKPDSVFGRQLDYWREQLAGLPEELALPYDRLRPAEMDRRGGTMPVRMPAGLHAGLLDLARREGATLFMVLHAGLSALLSRLGAGTDIPVGTVVAGRPDEALDDLVGFFVNTLVLRADTSGDPSFRELLARVRETDLAAYDHQDVPFDTVVEAVNPVRSRTRHPLFQTVLMLASYGEADFHLPGVATVWLSQGDGSAGPTEFDLGPVDWELTFILEERYAADGAPAGLVGDVVYRTDMFNAETVQGLVERLALLLEGALAAQDAPVSRLEIMPAAERDTVLRVWNDTALPVPPGTLAGLFADQVARTPDDPAVTDAAGTLSYTQLDQRANHLAHRLVAAGAGPDVPVAILADRSAELIVSILGVLKAGSCYLPLPVGAPTSRLAQIIANAGAPILIADRDHDLDVPCELRPEPGSSPTPPPVTAGPENLAYIIYTSGSTGTPKGVAITNQNVVVFVKDTMVMAEETGGGTWRSLMYAPHSFDASTSEIWPPLVSGGEIVVLAPGPLDLVTLARTIVDEQINVAQFTPTLFALMADYAMEALGHLFLVSVGGERISASVFQRVVDACPDTIVNNGYGPTETTVTATWYMMSAGHRLEGRVPIGRPVSNTAAYLLDRHLRPVPPGVPGELYVGGPRVGRGYVGGPGLTAERFVADPFGPAGQRLYRTGDIARWNHDGTLDFLERSDFQVKIRGNRVEPAEIEVVLESHPGVSRAAVIAGEDQSGAAYLAAYLIPRSAPIRDVKEMVTKRLPGYMVPSAFVTLDELPLTAHGKLDRKALPEPVLSWATSEEKPATPEEEVIAGLFAELLGLPAVGRNDSFFDLGGHSLLATQLARRLGEVFEHDIPVPLLFEAPTVATLAARLLNEPALTEQSLAVLLPLREGTGAPLFCVHPAEGMSWCYASLLQYLDPSVPVYGIQARGLTGHGDLPASLDDAAADYLWQIRAVQPSGPYFLLGWSYGGVVAQAIATRLQADGQKVGMLALLDSYPAPHDAAELSEDEILALAFAGLDVAETDGRTATDLLHELRQRGSALGDLTDEALAGVLRVTENNVRLLLGFKPDTYHGSALLFQAAKEGDNDNEAKRWQPYITGGVTTYLIDSGHFHMMSPEALSDIGPIVAAEIMENRAYE